MEAVHRLTTINVALAKHHRSKVIAGAGSSGGGESSGGSEADDTLESKAYMSILDLLGEGQIGGLVDGSPSSIFLNDTPLVSKTGQYNFDNVTWAILTGSQTQDSLGEGFDNAEFTQSLNQLVKNATPLTFTITDPNASQVRVVVATPALISTDKKGNINGSAVRFSFALSLNSGPFEELGIGQIKGKTRSRFQREYSHILPKTTSTGKKVTSWTIRVARTSPDSSSTSVQNDLYVDSYSVAVGSRLTYPNSAIVGINFNAEQFSSVPTRSYLVDGLLVKVPSNYDPKTRVYTGVWDGTFKLAVTDNPAWILYDVITNARYGLGSFIDPSLANPARLYVIGRYCDEMVDDGFGGQEPRFSINTCINSRADAYQLISDISSAFNGMTYWTGGLLGYMADMPTEVSMVYSAANVIDGMFNYAGAARKDMHSVVLVTWNDPARNYQTSVEYVEDQELVERFGVRKAEITSFGCTSRGQAHRIGKWLLYTERYQSKTISFNVGIDSSFVLPGDVIQIVDADRAGSRLGGRLKKVAADFAVLDAPIDAALIKANTTISMRLPDGKFTERLIASVGVNVDTDEQVIYWETPLTKLPLANAMWVISSPELEPQTARIVSVGQGENAGEFSITAIPHNINKFGHIESDLILETPNTSLVSPSVIVPTASVTIVQEARIDQGITVRDMSISWEQVANAVSYEVKYRKGEGNWLTLPTVKGLSVDIQNIYQGEYQAQVVAVSSTGSKSRVAYSDMVLLDGQASTLPKLSSFTAKAAQFGIELDWLYGAGTVGVSHTEVHSSLDGKTFTLLGTYPDPLQHHAIGGLYVASTHWFKARIADKYGNFGEWSNIVSASPDVSPDKVLDVLSDSIGPSQLENSVNTKLQDAFDTSKQAVADAEEAHQAVKDEVLARTTALQTEAADRSSAISTALNKEAADRSSAISAESTARTSAITAEATARANAIAAEATARTSAIAKEVTDRNAAISVETNARTKAITDKATEINADVAAKIKTVNDGITKEITDRTAGDDAVRGELTTYKSSNDTAVAAVVKDVKTVTTAQAATASDVSGLQSTMTAVQGTLSKKADAAALSSLDTKVETINGQVTSQGTSITTLNANLVTTNNNVATAQNAANAANTLAGGKGKVIVQAAAPVIADRLAQNLWIDITGGANTPKRWLTNAWVAVTDKVATDAAAAAANALRVANTKADAAAFNTLDAKVTTIEGNVTSQGTSITKLTNDLATTNTNVAKKADTTALTALDTKVTAVDGKVATNASAITTLQGRATTIEGNVAKKAEATALNNYYTKTETEAVAAGKVDNYKASLVIGGVNQLLNSEGERSSTAASRREYLMYENSEFLRQFYEENLGREVTISFDLKVAVAGAVTVYCSNGTYHTFSAGVNVLPANVDTWVRYSVTVRPARHSTNTTSTRSGLEFYGTYDSGRIPYVRKVQLEAGNVATAWSPSPRDTQAALDANSTAIDATNTEVTRVDGVVKAQGSSISKLQSDLTATDTKAGTALTNAATAQSTANTGVTKADAAASATNTLKAAYEAKVANLDAADKTNADAIVKTNTDLTNAQTALSNADTALGNRIDSITTTVQNNDTAVKGQIKDVADSVTTLTGNTNTRFTSLESGLNTANTNIGKKADAAALTALTTRVTNAEGVNTSQGTSITSLTNDLATTTTNAGKALSAVEVKDTRSTNELPSWYWTNHAKRIVNEFKSASVIGVTGLGAYVNLETRVYYGDASGGPILQTAIGVSNPLLQMVRRSSGSGTAAVWSAWEQPLKTMNDTINTKASTAALTTLDSKVTSIDGRVTANANSITTLRADLTETNELLNTTKTATATAQDTANTAVTNNAATASRVNSLESKMATAEGAIAKKAEASALNNYYTKTEADSSAAGAIQKYDATLSVGGKNLFSYTDWNASANTTSYSTVVPLAPIQLLPNTKYTISTNITKTSGNFDVFVMGVGIAPSSTVNGVALNEPRTLTTNATGIINVAMRGNTLNSTYNKWIQIERGDTATSFTPSEKDQASDLKVEIDANANAIQTTNSNVSNIDGKVAANTASINSQGSRLTVAENGLKTKAENSAVQAINTEVSKIAGELKSTSESATKLTAQLGALDSDSLIPDYNLADVNSWYSHYGYDLTGYFQKTTTGKVGGTVFKTDVTDGKTTCWNYSKTALPNTRSYKLSMLVRRSADSTSGTSYFTAQQLNANGAVDGYTHAGPMAITANGEWQLVERVVNFTSAQEAKPQLRFGFAIGHSSTAATKGTWEVQGYKVTAVLSTSDMDSSVATAEAVNTLGATVTQQGKDITSQSNSLTSLNNSLTVTNGEVLKAQNTANAAGEAVKTKADASAVSAMDTKISNIDGKVNNLATQSAILQSGLQTANGAISTKAEQSALNSTNSTLNTLSGKVETQAQSINTLTSKTATLESGMAVTDLIARASASGKLVYGDPTFKIGANDVGVYNNTYNGNVTVVRVAKQAKNPTSSGFEMKITSTGAASPALGGFVQAIASRASAVFLIKYIICLPLGYALYPAANPMGDGASDKFVGNANGTGKYETYYRLIKCGETGSFSSTGYVYINGPTPTAAAPLNWYLASIEAYDTTDFDDMTPQLRTTVAEVQSKVNTLTTNTGATAEKVESMSAYFDAGETVDNSNITADGGTNGAVRWTYHSMIVEGDMANAKAVDNMRAEMDGTLAEWGQVINSEVRDGMSALSEQVNHVSTSLGDQTTRIDTVMASVNGIYGKYTVTIDNNGVLSGFELISEGGSGGTKSTFGVNADNFYIGSPATGKRPFIVTTEPREINGITYPPGTWIDSAYIAEASIKMAHIDKASITSLSAVSATIGTLRTATTGARTEISDNLIKVYDENNVLRVRIGVWDDQDF